MSSKMAPLQGKKSLYCHLTGSKVMVLKGNYKFIVIKQETFNDLYVELNDFEAALKEDCIEYVECEEGVLKSEDGYPFWFLEPFTDAVDVSPELETYISFVDNDEAMAKEHCVFLRNKFGQIKGLTYHEFLKYYEPK